MKDEDHLMRLNVYKCTGPDTTYSRSWRNWVVWLPRHCHIQKVVSVRWSPLWLEKGKHHSQFYEREKGRPGELQAGETHLCVHWTRAPQQTLPKVTCICACVCTHLSDTDIFPQAGVFMCGQHSSTQSTGGSTSDGNRPCLIFKLYLVLLNIVTLYL